MIDLIKARRQSIMAKVDCPEQRFQAACDAIQEYRQEQALANIARATARKWRNKCQK